MDWLDRPKFMMLYFSERFAMTLIAASVAACGYNMEIWSSFRSQNTIAAEIEVAIS
jgi:uncharacterized protein involved in tolerance to divalent cations